MTPVRFGVGQLRILGRGDELSTAGKLLDDLAGAGGGWLMLRTSGSAVPLVLVLDDLQWADPTNEAVPPLDAGTFRRDGAVWELGYEGRTLRLPHAKGLADLAVLLRQPGEPTHVSELLSRQAPETEVASGVGDEIFDARARREIRARIENLGVDIDEARTAGDAHRGASAKAERDELIHALSVAVNRNGRPRVLGDGLERARKTVTARIRNSIRRVGGGHAALGRHLDRAVDTGVWCVYRPERPVSWHLE